MRSPGIRRAIETRLPLTNVPFVLSRSLTSRSPSADTVTRQCTRDTRAASTMKSAPAARPMVLTPFGRMRKVCSFSASLVVRRIHTGGRGRGKWEGLSQGTGPSLRALLVQCLVECGLELGRVRSHLAREERDDLAVLVDDVLAEVPRRQVA